MNVKRTSDGPCFAVESTGALKPEEIVVNALRVLAGLRGETLFFTSFSRASRLRLATSV